MADQDINEVIELHNIENLLKSWGLSQNVIQKFEDEQIDFEVLPHLTEDVIEKLIPCIGPRIKFKLKLDSYKLGVSSLSENISDTIDSSFVHISDLGSTDSADNSNISNLSTNDDTDTSCVSINSSFENEPECKKMKFEHKYEDYDLKTILESSINGKALLANYRTHKLFSDRDRSLLAELVISKELTHDVDKRLSRERLQFLTSKIVDLFPTEIKETWFIAQYYPNGKSTGKGKLVTKYYNTRRILTKCGLIGAEKPPNSPEGITEDIDPELDELIQWLKNSTHPWPQVLEFWEKTFKKRYDKLISENEQVYEYFKDFPPLREPLGYTLLEGDFDKLYPESSLKLYTEWDRLSKFIAAHIPNSHSFLDGINTDERNNKVLLNFAKIFQPITSIKKRNVGQWRPSRIETQEAFLLHVKGTGDIQPTLDLRREKLKKFGLTLQPQAIVVGVGENEITESYVFIDNKMYEVQSPLKAIDIVFKVFHSLHARYPAEAEHIWTFLQIAVYNIQTKWDKNFSTVNSLLSDYKNA